MKKYLKTCKNQKNRLIASFLLLITTSIITVRLPFILSDVMEYLTNISRYNYVTFFLSFGLYIALSILVMILSFFSSLILKKVGIANSKSYSSFIFDKIYSAIIKHPPQFENSSMIQTVNRDVFDMNAQGIELIYQTVYMAINVIAISFFMLTSNLLLALLLICIFLIIMFIQLHVNKKIKKKIEDIREAGGQYTLTSTELVNNYRDYRKINSKKNCFREIL